MKRGASLTSAIDFYLKAIQLDPKFTWPHNNLAWMLATSHDSSILDGLGAILHAVEACELSNWSSWEFLDTLAAAFARAGNFDRAIDVEEAALQLSPDSRKASSREKILGFRRGDAFTDNGDPAVGVCRGITDCETLSAFPEFLGPCLSGPQVPGDLEREFWGMSREKMVVLCPEAVTNSEGDLFLEAEIAGESSSVLFVFVDDALCGTLVHRNYGSDRELAIRRFRLLYHLLKNRYGNPTEKSRRSCRKARKTDDGNLDEPMLFACWKDQGTDILLVCSRIHVRGLHTSIIYQHLPYPCTPLIQDYSIYLSLLEDRLTGSYAEKRSDPGSLHSVDSSDGETGLMSEQVKDEQVSEPQVERSHQDFEEPRWGMSRQEIEVLYPDATQTVDGGLAITREIAGEISIIRFSFESWGFCSLSLNPEYGEDGNAAVVRFLALKGYLRRRAGPPTDEWQDLNGWHRKSHEDQSFWGDAIASGQLLLFAFWETHETEIWLTCYQHEEDEEGEKGSVFTSMEYHPSDTQ